MEHRCGTRRAIQVPVVLHPRGASPLPANTREVSISGMFVETPPSLLVLNAVLEVELTLPAATGLRTYRWLAMVVRATPAGVGLMFDRLRPPAILRLLARHDATEPETRRAGDLPANVVALRSSADKVQTPL